MVEQREIASESPPDSWGQPPGWPRVAPGHAAPPEELEYAREAGIF